MNDRMDLTKEQFLKLPTTERDACIFENVSEIKRLIRGYKFYYRLTTVIGSVLIVGVGILFKMRLGAGNI